MTLSVIYQEKPGFQLGSYRFRDISFLPTTPVWWFPLPVSIVLILIISIDVRRRRIPHVLTIGGTVVALVGRGMISAEAVLLGCLGVIVSAVLFGAIYLFARRRYGARALGFGDVMLTTLIGALLGPIGALWVLAAGMLLAGGYALWLRQRHPDRSNLTMPLAPFLALPALVALWLPAWRIG
ncbi:MAG: A24 family peptidase [Anaerolineae bacterium]|nr:A24 family peptidase [Anaerolineae bacterium]